MITASKEFKEKLKSGANLVNYADIVLSDGTELHLTYKDFMIGGCQVEDKTTSGKFGVGSVIGKTLSMRIANYDERFSKYDFYNSVIHLYVAMLLDDGTVEKIRKGIYYTIVPETPGNIIEINAVDGMYRLDKDYSTSTTAYPATLQAIISDACIDCGIPIGFRQFDNMDFIVYEKPEKATYRQIVSYVAQISGYNARIDNNGYMKLVWYNAVLLEQYSLIGGGFKTYSHDIVIDGGNFTDYSADTVISGGNFADEMPEHIFRIKSLSVSTDDVQITGVKVTGDDKREALFGEAGYLIEVKSNPFVNLREQEVADYLGNRMVGIIFRPFSAQVLNNPLYEPFEVVRISDSKGNVYNSIINSVSYKIGGYTQISCQAEEPARNESFYSSPAADAVVEARKNTEKQLTTYDKVVQNMNQLAANAMGLYRESERQPDGSYIYYQSNKPITVDDDGVCGFVDGAVVYKSAAEGFFVSTDGGKSFTSGFDAQGNAVVNVLSAIGLTFDWAKGGTISLGGTDNRNGRLLIFDKDNNQVGQIDNAGLAFYSATTKTQFILSPIFGLIQRDANGNEFNGFIYDEIISVNKTEGTDLEYLYNAVCRNYCTVTLNNAITITNNETIGLRTTYRRYKYTANRHNIYWKGIITHKNNDAEGYLDIELPEKFHGKDWLVLLVFDGWNSNIGDFQYSRINRYGTNVPDVYDGQQWVDAYYRYYESTMYPASGDDVRLGEKELYSVDYTTALETFLDSYGDCTSKGDIVQNAKTKVISHMVPQKSTDTMFPGYGETMNADISENVASLFGSALENNSLPSPNLRYEVLDREKTTLRVYCNAYIDNYNISQMAKIRVIVSA